MSSDEQPEIPREVQDAIEPAAANFVALRDDLIEGANYYIRATGAIDAPDRREVVAWLVRFAEHGHALDEFALLGIDAGLGEPLISPQARDLHTALAASMALLLSPDAHVRARMLTPDELMERMETKEVVGRWE